MTCSEDGTLRVWDVMEVQQKTVIKPQVSNGRRHVSRHCLMTLLPRL